MRLLGRKPILRLLVLPILLLQAAGCEQLIGLSRDYPPPLDAASDDQTESVPDAEDEDIITEPGESTCLLMPYVVLTEIESDISREPAADFLGDNNNGIFGVAWRWGDANEGDLKFTRVDVDGLRLDDQALNITTDDMSFFPDIAAADDGFGIVWQEDILAGSDADYELRYTYVDENGNQVVSEPYPSIESPGTGMAHQAAISWNGTEAQFGVAWQDSRSGTDEIYFTTITKRGSIPEIPRAVTTGPGKSMVPDIAWSGSEFGLVWLNDQTGHNGVYFARLGPSGDMAGEIRILYDSEGASGHPRIAADTNGFGMVWSDEAGDVSAVFFSRLGWSGEDLTGNVPVTAFRDRVLRNPDIFFSPSQNLFHLCWEDDRANSNFDIFVTSLEVIGQKRTFEMQVPDPGGASTVCVVSRGGDRNVVIWAQTMGTNLGDLFFDIFSCAP